MKRALYSALSAFCLLSMMAAGCSLTTSSDEPDEGSGDAIWVALQVSGGQLCGPRIEFEPPDTAELLAEVDVAVLETRIEAQAGCEACNCPSYNALHLARIRSSNLDRAREAGFDWVEPS